MASVEAIARPMPWWKEPTKDQWYAYVAAWSGWTLDAFDFTAFLLIIAPIAKAVFLLALSPRQRILSRHRTAEPSGRFSARGSDHLPT
jgi:hypothetical protein